MYRYNGKRELEGLKEFAADMSTNSEPFKMPFVLNVSSVLCCCRALALLTSVRLLALAQTGVAVIDDNFPMLRDDMIQLYKFKKAALGAVFGVGVLVGLLLSKCCCCRGCSTPSKKKTE